MSDSIRFKRGPKSNLSVLGLGEPGLTTDPDDQRLYIGGPSGNIPIPNMNDINNLTKNFYYSIQEVNAEYNDNTPLGTIIESMMNNSTLTARVSPSDTTNYPYLAYGNLTIIKSIDNATLFYSKKNTADAICIATWRKGDASTGFGVSRWFDITNLPEKTTGGITYYISPNGSNDNDGLTANTPFSTIQYAINLLPKNINHGVEILLAEGTYNELVTISGFYGSGSIRIVGGTNLSDASKYKINRLSIQRNTLLISTNSIELTDTQNSACIVQYSNNALFRYIKIISSALEKNGFDISFSSVTISNSIISNRKVGVYTSNNSIVMISDTSGTGNNTAIQAIYNSTVGKYLATIEGNSTDAVSRGGQIRQ